MITSRDELKVTLLAIALAAGQGCSAGRNAPATSPGARASETPSARRSRSRSSAEDESAGPKHPLLVAAMQGDLSRVKQLVSEGADPATREGRRTAISLAAAGGHTRVVSYLLSLKLPGAEREEALVFASGMGRLDTVRTLLDARVSPNAKDEHGISPLILSAYAGQISVVELLLSRGADPNQRNDDNEVALHSSAAAATPNADPIVVLLLTHAARVDLIDKYGRTPLNNHAQAGHAGAVRALLDAHSEIEHADADGQTPLVSGALSGSVEVVTELLKRGADKNHANRFGATPVLLAASKGDVRVLETLIGAGADLARRLPDGSSALDVAIRDDHADAVECLLGHGLDPNSSLTGWPPLMAAASAGSTHVVPVVVRHGGNPNLLVEAKPSVEVSPLMIAAASKHPETLRALIDAGADVNLAGKGKATALHMAALEGCIECVRVLIGTGAAIDAKNEQGGTPLRSAADGGHADIVKLLIDHGALPNPRDVFGKLPIDYARENGHMDVVEVLDRFR